MKKGTRRFTFNVYDMEDEKVIIKGGNKEEVAKALGVSERTVYSYSEENKIFGKRYKITREKTEEQLAREQASKERIKGVTSEMLRQWDEIHLAAKLIKMGKAKIVTNEKGEKYTVVK